VQDNLPVWQELVSTLAPPYLADQMPTANLTTTIVLGANAKLDSLKESMENAFLVSIAAIL